MIDSNTPHRADSLARCFLVGCPKSGTTWMQALLESHPEVCSRGEASFGMLLVSPMLELLSAYNKNQRAGESNVFTGEDALMLARGAIQTLQRRWVDQRDEPDRVRVISDKTPESALALDQLNAVFPEMRVIHIIRDARDCVVSGWHHNIRKGEQVFRAKFKTMERYAYHFVKNNWASYINRTQQWGRQHPDRYLEVRYEDLLVSGHKHAQRIFAFLGVNTQESQIEECVARASFKSLAGGRDPGQVDNASHFRKGQAGGWRDELDDASVQTIDRIAGELLETLGYERAASLIV